MEEEDAVRRMGAVLGLVVASGWILSAQAPADDRTAEQVYKNIKALTGTPASELNQSMHLMKGR